ncbi:hypothetical protein [Rhizobium metallidurans]|uniref:Uncharacterized protein n=1 Tax=Rhizobium metallidurans TaxID=1265931 RepID=A0A7W6CVK8_9HYPH|nr:hypothetical protein [Rhizobium metallidurans]MBB3965928.1 hypothetical protein [Rhizobium metallidurans]
MLDDLLIILGSAAAAFTAGLLVAAAILLGRAGSLVARLKSKSCPIAVDDEREHSPWRHM